MKIRKDKDVFMRKSRKAIWAGIVLVVVMMAAAAVVLAGIGTSEQKKEDYRRLQEESYNGIFAANYPITYFDEEVFEVYRGLLVVKAGQTMEKSKDFAHFFNEAWESPNVITNVYLGIDPYELWKEAGKDPDKWHRLVEERFTRYVQAHPDVIFEILLPVYSLESWLAQEEAYLTECMAAYRRWLDALGGYENVIQYFVGGREWMIANPANFTERQVNKDIAKKLVLLCFCDREYVITPVNADVLLGELEGIAAAEKAHPTQYADLSEYEVVFFGDSILANGEGSHSIPGIFGGLTDAAWYNLAVGGIPATVDPNAAFSFPSMADAFIRQDVEGLAQDSSYTQGLAAYLAEPRREKLVFVLNFGLNDYFGGHPVDREDPMDENTYAGALRTGIKMLQEAYPEAKIIVQTPTYTVLFGEGTEVRCGDGTDRVLQDYVDAAILIAEEMGVECLDNYYDFEMNGNNYEIYLADGCHPNDLGRLVFGQRLIRFMEAMVTDEN